VSLPIWIYQCRRCRFRSRSERHDLTICTAQHGEFKITCGGRLGEPYAYRDELLAAGLISQKPTELP
jgi:hypothetical protein